MLTDTPTSAANTGVLKVAAAIATAIIRRFILNLLVLLNKLKKRIVHIAIYMSLHHSLRPLPLSCPCPCFGSFGVSLICCLSFCCGLGFCCSLWTAPCPRCIGSGEDLCTSTPLFCGDCGRGSTSCGDCCLGA